MPSRVYEIEYHRFTRTKKNLDFKGKGTFEIADDGQSFVFRGRQATLLGIRSESILDLHAVANVTQAGDLISFSTTKGESGSKKKPFLFYCDSPETAAEIASQLPASSTSP